MIKNSTKQCLTRMSCAWVEKYRPKRLERVMMPADTRQRLDELKNSPDMPHLLFYGPPGVGKTSAVMAMCREIFGPKLSERVVELNASDKRGINVVRGTIKNMASAAIGAPDPNYPCPGFRIIVLDEADTMTIDAQSALRKIMEDYSLTTRFILICNYTNNISEPILSRCPSIQFKPIAHPDMARRLQKIATKEGMNVTSEVLDTIVEISGGDMRIGITTLQNTNSLLAAGREPTPDNILEMVGLMKPGVVKHMICQINSISSAQKLAKTIELDALPVHMFLQTLVELILASDRSYGNILLQISSAEAELSKGANAYLQLMALFTRYWYEYVRTKK
jgi:replication factor C subunit 2/4